MAILALNNVTVKLLTSTQVITSVSSVVKELVENSLDADAKNIEINLTDNGSSLIEIRDDGYGISVADVPNMAMPHYTSKILDFSDLDSLTTYGFRGEALNAICRVAEVEITTKTVNDETAKLYKLDGNGGIVSTELSHRFVGTTVRVKKLFENLPVRRQLLNNPRKSKQEVKLIESLLKSLSVCQPVVRMSYRVNNHLVFLKPSCNSVREAFSHFVGSKVAANMEWIHNEESEVKLQLMIPKRDLADPQLVYETNEKYVIVNNRPVKYKQFEKIIQERISDHFGGKALSKKHPVYLISVTVAANDIDVNLEPNKTSVLLKNQDIILKKLDKILVEFYNISDENTRPDLSASNTTIDPSPEYHDITVNIPSDVEMPACKKMKLNNNRQRVRDFIVDVNTESPAGGKRKGEKRSSNIDLTPQRRNTNSNDNPVNLGINPQEISKDDKTASSDGQARESKPSDRDSVDSLDRILRTFPGPVLSDSDGESIADAEAPRKRSGETPLKIGHAVRSTDTGAASDKPNGKNDSEAFSDLPLPDTTTAAKISADGTEPNASNNDFDTLSQLPVVDLGEDFDIEAILERPPPAKIPKLEDASCPSETFEEENDTANVNEANGVERLNSTAVLWSRGQIPGLKGSTDVSTYNDPKNKAKSSNESQPKADANSHTIYHTGFSKFSYEIRSQVLEENPGATLPAVGKILANRWKELSPEERGYYRDLALEEKKIAEVEKKKAKNKQLSQQESDKNKARLIQMLETMKKTKSNKKCPVTERTTISWEINIQNVTKSFFARPVSEEERVIGPLTDEIWAVKSGGRIIVVNSSEVLKAIDPKELEEQETNPQKTAEILQSWLSEKSTNSAPAIMHPIHNIGASLV